MSDKKPGAEPPEGAKAIVKAVENAKILPDPMSVAAAEEIDANIARVDKSRADGDLINVDDFVVDDFQKKPAHEAADGAGKSPGAAASGGSDGGKKRPPRGHGGPPQDSDDGRIVIRRGASTRAREVNEAMSALASEPSEFYVCGTKIVRPELVTIAGVGDDEVKTAPGLAEASIATIAWALDRRTKWEVFDKRSNDWLGKNSPKDICEQILACGGEAKFPPISGIIAGPAMRPDGSIIFALGYDSRSRVFYLASKALAIDPVPVCR